jgi:predicted flap endonuclease-1-like 5' DNA nuclease
MSDSLASFRELKGVGPATEARLHEAGVFTWEALSQVAAALGSVRGATGESLHDLSGRIAEHAAVAGAGGPRPPNADRNEAFIVRIVVADGGEPIRSTMIHVRTQTERSSTGWSGDELLRFIEEHAGMPVGAAPAAADERAAEQAPADRAASADQAATAPRRRPSRVHVAVLDAGKAIGGASRDIELDLATDKVGDVPELEYQATLSGRPFGGAGGPSTWTTLARQAGRVAVSDRLPLRFTAVALPPGIQRLRVEVALRLPELTEDAPKLAIA